MQIKSLVKNNIRVRTPSWARKNYYDSNKVLWHGSWEVRKLTIYYGLLSILDGLICTCSFGFLYSTFAGNIAVKMLRGMVDAAKKERMKK